MWQFVVVTLQQFHVSIDSWVPLLLSNQHRQNQQVIVGCNGCRYCRHLSSRCLSVLCVTRRHSRTMQLLLLCTSPPTQKLGYGCKDPKTATSNTWRERLTFSIRYLKWALCYQINLCKEKSKPLIVIMWTKRKSKMAPNQWAQCTEHSYCTKLSHCN